MTISQDPLLEIDPTLYEAVIFFLLFGIPRWLPFAVTKNNAEHENDNISITA